MAERYILATDRVALAIRRGHQTQDRRPVRLAEFGPSDTPAYDFTFRDRRALWNDLRRGTLIAYYAPWQPGDLLYVREAHQIESGLSGASREHCFWAYVTYRADGERLYFEPDMEGWSMSLDFHRVTPVRPNIHMPKWAARTWVRVSRVWVERVRDISDADAQAEGFLHREAFAEWWTNQYGKSWILNDFVWCCEFEREEQGR